MAIFGADLGGRTDSRVPARRAAARLALWGMIATVAVGCASSPSVSSPYRQPSEPADAVAELPIGPAGDPSGRPVELDGPESTAAVASIAATSHPATYEVQSGGCSWVMPWDGLNIKAQKQACWAEAHLAVVSEQEGIAWDLVRANPSSKFVIGFPISKVRGVAAAIRKAESEAKAADKNSKNATSYASQGRAAAARERNAAKKARLQNIADDASYYASTASSAASTALAKARALKTAIIR